MAICPTCRVELPATGETCARCASGAVMVTVCLSPDASPGIARFDSRFPTPSPATVFRPADPSLILTPAPSGAPTPPPTGSPLTPSVPSPVVRLRVIRGHRVNVEYPVYPGRNVVGRFADRPVDIDLTGLEPDGQVWSSRHHAALTLDKALLVVEDLNSLNGTWVNGARIRAGGAVPLKSGDVIQIGVVQLRVLVDDAAGQVRL